MTQALPRHRQMSFEIWDFGSSCWFRISSFGFRISLILVLMSCCLIPRPTSAGTSASLEEGFRRPPQSAGVRCFWWWLNGNVTKEAITRDLEEMRAKGFSGAMIFDAGGAEQRGNRQVPAGPMFATPAWKELFVHAVKEADRLGLELSLNIQSGWNLGGPVVTPEMAAKMLTWSEIQIEGPAAFHDKMPQPQIRDGFYRDIALLAYREKSGTTGGSQKAEGLEDGSSPGRQDHRQASPDAATRNTTENKTRAPIRDLALKTASKEIGMSAPDCRFLLTDVPATPGEEDVRVADVLDISKHLSPDGELAWDAPAGKWTILRFGYTPSPARVSTSSAGWQGRVIDYMDAAILRQYWDIVVAPLLADVGPLAGKSLKYLHTDSWECGGANWTESLPQQFEQRRKYNPLPYLPVIAGKIVESRDVSNRFLADFRKTLGDCIAENHYSTFAQLAHEHGMGIHPESGGPHAGPFDGLKCLGRNDIAMSEFWVPSPHRPTPEQRFFVKQAASAAHAYGGQIVGAEAFTSIGPHWNDVLWSSQKPSFDHEACSGLNLAFLHTFTCSPQEMGLPGQEYFAGTHINPNVTWWEMAGPFMAYMARCQYMLRQGRFVADVCHYAGDHVPNIMPLKEADPARVLPGYDYDFLSEEMLTRLRVENGRLSLPGGMYYRILSLPDHGVMSIVALETVAGLVRAGATVVGPKSERTASLTDHPRCDEQLARLSEELWGANPTDSGVKTVARGRMLWGKAARQVLAEDGVPPDFEYHVQGEPAILDYIHRQSNDGDIYFVCNQSDREVLAECRFRVAGKRPELWDPVTGGIKPAGNISQTGERTHVSLSFAPYGSWFVVFRGEGVPPLSSTAAVVRPLRRLDGPWHVAFISPWGDTFDKTMTELSDWAKHSDDRVRYHSGKAVYKHTFELSTDEQRNAVGLLLDLGRVEDVGIARVLLNDKDLGIIWTKPFRVDISAAARPGTNRLQVEIINSWRNRLLGDQRLPADQRKTATNITVAPNWKPTRSGLLGPVTIMRETQERNEGR